MIIITITLCTVEERWRALDYRRVFIRIRIKNLITSNKGGQQTPTGNRVN